MTEIVGRAGTYPSYQDYLQSEEWSIRRRWALKRATERCQLCYAAGHLHVHHRTYARVGNEELSDLTVLCDDCHAWFHVPRTERVMLEAQTYRDSAQGQDDDMERFRRSIGRALRMDRPNDGA